MKMLLRKRTLLGREPVAILYVRDDDGRERSYYAISDECGVVTTLDAVKRAKGRAEAFVQDLKNLGYDLGQHAEGEILLEFDVTV